MTTTVNIPGNWTKGDLIFAAAALIFVVVLLIWIANQDGGYDPGPGPRPYPVDGEVQELARDAIHRMAEEYALASEAVAERIDRGDVETHEDYHREAKTAFDRARQKAFADLGEAEQEALGQRSERDRFDSRGASRFSRERAEGFRGAR